MRTGNGKEFYDNDHLLYEGEYENNKWHSNGKMFYDNHIVYDGEWKNNIPVVI